MCDGGAHAIRLSAVLMLGAFVAAGCGRQPTLTPAADASRLPGHRDVATAYVKGVAVNANGAAWNGNPEIRKHVTRMQVSIENTTNQPVRIQYSDFHLVDPDGKAYAALPPFSSQRRCSWSTLWSTSHRRSPRSGCSRRIPGVTGLRSAVPRASGLSGRHPLRPIRLRRLRSLLRHRALRERRRRRCWCARFPRGVLNPGGTVVGFLLRARQSRQRRPTSSRRTS